ncbi:hypothetical protein [Corynebacterium glutamicum]|uniref:hypothetical protein n=1 Tax=Corynebacterium glutamicum TaxID=1718 RepID=UPI00146899C6|nr:hypothetical protein [Corynebacterium glutamicum]GFK19296.1 hypothetical protein KbCgl_18680 [Corynebacterium glutamicum]
MSWISKSLTLDLLAITIDGLTKVFERITAEPDTPTDQSPWSEQPAAPVNVELPADTPVPSSTVRQAAQEAQQALNEAQQASQTAPAPAPQAQPAPAAAQPAAPVEDLRPQAQDALRRIAQTEGTDWIRETLFPHFGTSTLNDIPAERLQEVIAMATTRLELGATTA